MKSCRHFRLTEFVKSFLCMECNKTLCPSCVYEDLSLKQCESCCQTFNKDDLTATNCTVCKKCPLCKLVVTKPEQEGESTRLLRRCHGCKAKFGGYLMSDTVHNNILKVKGLISHYRSYEFRGAGDNNGLINYWNSPVPSRIAVSEAQEVSEIDNCVDFFCRNDFNIDWATPLKQRLQVPCKQTPWVSQMSPVPLLLKPKYTYYCNRCDNMVLTTDAP